MERIINAVFNVFTIIGILFVIISILIYFQGYRFFYADCFSTAYPSSLICNGSFVITKLTLPPQ